MTDNKRQIVYDFIRHIWGNSEHAQRLIEVWSKVGDEQVENMCETIRRLQKHMKKTQPVIDEMIYEAGKRGPITSEEIEKILAG